MRNNEKNYTDFHKDHHASEQLNHEVKAATDGYEAPKVIVHSESKADEQLHISACASFSF